MMIHYKILGVQNDKATSAGIEHRASGGVVVMGDSKRICDLNSRVSVYSLAFSGQGSSNILDGCVICTICEERE
jgi:hypothetical protein